MAIQRRNDSYAPRQSFNHQNNQNNNRQGNYQRDNYQRDNYQRDNYQRDNYRVGRTPNIKYTPNVPNKDVRETPEPQQEYKSFLVAMILPALPKQIRDHYTYNNVEEGTTEGVFFGTDEDGSDFIQVDFTDGKFDVWKYLRNENYRREFDPRYNHLQYGVKPSFPRYWKITESDFYADEEGK